MRARLLILLLASTMALPLRADPQQKSTLAPADETDLIPFDERIYALSYEIFLANRNLRDAYSVAAAAVRQRPDDFKWRERLAQVSEWTQHPQEALTQWRALAGERGDAPSCDALRRLAPALFDFDTFIEVLKRDALAGRLDAKGLDALVNAFENAGRPHDGVEFLLSLDRTHPRQEYLEKVAFLQRRMGRDADTLATLQTLTERYGPRTDWALTAAALHILHADMESAYRALEEARAVANPDQAPYWTLLAELALQTQRNDDARNALRQLATHSTGNPGLLTRLLTLLNNRPEDAVRVAQQGWRQHKDPEFLIRALELHVQLRTFKRGEELLDSVPPAEIGKLSDNTRFLLARGGLSQGEGRLGEARADYEHALKLSPQDPSMQLAWLWLVIEMRDEAALRETTAGLNRASGLSGELIDALAAAYVTLGDLHAALPLFWQRLDAHGEDHVWLMDYADVLADTGYPDLAHPLRQRALLLLKQLATDGPRLAWPLAARLALTHTPGDPTARIVQALLALDGTSHEVDNATADALILWLMRSEQYERASLWFWRRYAHALSKPAWAEFALALHNRDRPRLAEMLADQGLRNDIDKYDRVQAAILLDEPMLARELAFESLEGRYPNDEQLHRNLIELLPETARMIALDLSYGERGVIEGPATRVFGRWPFSRALVVDGDLRYTRWDESEPTAIQDVPEDDWSLETLLTWRHLRLARTGLRAGVRGALDTFPYGELFHERQFNSLHARLSLGINLLAEEGSAMRVAGRQDKLQLDLNWTVTERIFLNTEIAGSLLDTQDGESLGSGARAVFTAGYKFRFDYPDYSLRLTTGFYDYSREQGAITGDAARLVPGGVTAGSSFFLPGDYTQYGIYVGFGEEYRERYTRRWRPFLDFGVTYNTASGIGTDLSAGIGGRVLGDDHLAFGIDRIEGGGGLGETDQILRAVYRYWY